MRISVIIPCYNVASYIERTVTSILSQSFGELELILINDGSTDSTLHKLSSIATKDPRVVVVNQKNIGVSSARNAGLARAQGDWILFVDGDDWIEPEVLSNFSSLDLSSIDILIFGFILHKPKGKNVLYLPPSNVRNMFISYVLGHRLIIPCMFFRRSLIVENGLYFDEQTYYGEDKEFMMKALLLSRGVLNIQKVEYHYDMTRTNSATNQSKYNERQLTLLFAIDRVVNFVDQHGNAEEKEAIAVHNAINTLYVYKRYLRLATSEQRKKYDSMFLERIKSAFKISPCISKNRYIVMFYLLKVVYSISPSIFQRILTKL